MLRWIGLLLYLLLIASAWVYRQALYQLAGQYFALIVALVGGLAVFVFLVPLIEIQQSRGYAGFWRQRLAKHGALPGEGRRRQGIRHAGDRFFQRLLAPLFRRSLGARMMGNWVDAGFGEQPASLLAAILFSTLGGYMLGYLPTRRLLLAAFSAFLAWIALGVFVTWRARLQRRRFGDQFPDVLDRLSDALQAGFSLPQAFDFVVPNLLEPSASEMNKIASQISLGYAIDEALTELYKRRPSEDVRLLVEGLTLQRQVGGDMPTMMREMATYVRGRVELENEVRTLTAQGRLSAVVIALLVPISVGILSLFPGYTEVLFQTTLGNMVLIVAGILELIGAAIVSRLVRIDF
jgi:tight adherence protein B